MVIEIKIRVDPLKMPPEVVGPSSPIIYDLQRSHLERLPAQAVPLVPLNFYLTNINPLHLVDFRLG